MFRIYLKYLGEPGYTAMALPDPGRYVDAPAQGMWHGSFVHLLKLIIQTSICLQEEQMKRFLVFSVVALFCVSISYADLKDGLIMYLPLEEGSGTVTADASGNGHDGELQGAAEWIDGKVGKALKFAVGADHVVIPDDAAFHIEGAITQAAWVQLDRLPSAHAIIFGTREGGAGRNIGFGFGMNPSNGIKVWTNGATGGFRDINDNDTALEPGTWYHLAYTHTDDNNGLVEIYVDGQVTHSEESDNPVAPAGTTGNVTLGTWGGEAWPGSADEAALWNRALSADEIQQFMNGGITAVEANGKLAETWGHLKISVR